MPSGAKQQPDQRPARLARAQAVWLLLLASMTVVGGLLLLLDSKPIPRIDGLALPALASTGSPNSLESIFRTRSPLDQERWRGVVIHHSGSTSGSPEQIAREHERLGYRGLGHHFIVGNGNGMADGELYVGHRWLHQLPGAHAGGMNADTHNRHSISICLVGDGNRRPFSQAQMTRLAQLVRSICREMEIPTSGVMLHRDVAPTDDPGRLFAERWFREQLDAG